MKVQDIRDVAKRQGVNPGRMKKADLVKTIQRAEGNYDCFETIKVETCGQMDCLWREDCLKAVR